MFVHGTRSKFIHIQHSFIHKGRNIVNILVVLVMMISEKIFTRTLDVVVTIGVRCVILSTSTLSRAHPSKSDHERQRCVCYWSFRCMTTIRQTTAENLSINYSDLNARTNLVCQTTIEWTYRLFVSDQTTIDRRCPRVVVVNKYTWRSATCTLAVS
jgi:hypothetical protein